MNEYGDFGPAQKELLKASANGNYKYYILPGSIRSGKTYIGTLAFFIDAIKRKGDYIVAGKSIGAIKRTIVPELMMHSRMLGGEINLNWSDSKGSIGDTHFHFFGAVNDKSQDVLQGMTASGALLDEVVLFPENFIQQTIARCSVEGSRVFMTCNPEGPRHRIKINYIDKANKINAYVRKFGLDDNPSLSDETKEFYKNSFQGVFYDRMILGEWAVAEGAVFRSYTVAQEPTGRSEDTIVGVDMGISNTTAACVTKKIKGKDYIVDEYYYAIDDIQKTPITAGQHAVNIANKFERHKPRHYYIDPSASALYSELRALGLPVIMGDNDVLEGIRTLDVRFGKQQLIVCENCTNLLDELAEYRWDAKKQSVGIDAPIKENDHLIDALRYNIFTRYRFTGAQAFDIDKPEGY